MAGQEPPLLRHADELGWHLDIPGAIDASGPGIIEWRIEGTGAAIVRATVIDRAIRQYAESVWRLRQGLPHRIGAYRTIHRVLGAAADAGADVTVVALENCDVADLATRKKHWTALRGTLDGAD